MQIIFYNSAEAFEDSRIHMKFKVFPTLLLLLMIAGRDLFGQLSKKMSLNCQQVNQEETTVSKNKYPSKIKFIYIFVIRIYMPSCPYSKLPGHTSNVLLSYISDLFW